MPSDLARCLALAAALALAGPAEVGASGWEPVEVRAERQLLDPSWPERRALGHLAIEAGFLLQAADQRFGGLSGLLVSADGSDLLAVGDRGLLWRARLAHDQAGRLVAIDGWQAAALVHSPEAAAGAARHDAEALAWLPDGGLAIAFEGHHRLRRLPPGPPDAPLEPLPTPAGLARSPANEGIEALADLPDGALLALSEGFAAGPGLVRGWRITAGVAEPLAWRPLAGLRPTAAERLGDLLLVLERGVSLLAGWQARIVVLPVAAVVAGAVLEGVELARLHAPLAIDNLEGLAARLGPDGKVLLYLVTDDNFSPLQRTLLLQLSIPAERLAELARGAGRRD